MLKKITYIFLIITLFSCESNKGVNIAYESEYELSLNAWNKLKKTNGNSYTYESSLISWIGSGSTTKITVINNQVSSREYIAFDIFDPKTGDYLGLKNKRITDLYNEDINTLNTNKQGAKPLTIEQLYSSCITEYLTVDTTENKITFAVDSNNLLSNCTYYTIGCQDDCSVGIHIKNFKWID